LNEAPGVQQLLCGLRAAETELIVVDGGSADATVELARAEADQLLQVGADRAAQMNAGLACARGEWVWFVHADTGLLAPLQDYLDAMLASEEWGFFALKLSGERRVFRIIEGFINWRSRFTSVVTGDQGLFVRRELLVHLGGFAEQPLMEDIELSKRLRGVAPPSSVRVCLQTSSRRWERAGVVATVLLMWRLRLLYFLGASPRWLARQYR
jgi:rSAM/selenodomain-associated transferase 2